MLGDWNWYLPSWLEWLPRVAHEEDAVPPVAFEPEREPAGEQLPAGVSA